jgi:hypothetical protein
MQGAPEMIPPCRDPTLHSGHLRRQSARQTAFVRPRERPILRQPDCPCLWSDKRTPGSCPEGGSEYNEEKERNMNLGFSMTERGVGQWSGCPRNRLIALSGGVLSTHRRFSRRLCEVLSVGIKIRSSPVFSREDRGAILNIVLDTKPALLDYWRQARSSLRPSSVTTPARPAQAE